MPQTSPSSVSSGTTSDERDDARVDEEAVRVESPSVRSASISSETRIVPSSAENAAPERPATMIAVMSGPSSRVDRQRHQVGDEDVGAELPELHDRLEGRHHADQEVIMTTIGTPSAPARSMMRVTSPQFMVAGRRTVASAAASRLPR